MKIKDYHINNTKEIRQWVKCFAPQNIKTMTSEEIERMVHELAQQQIDLQIQNEELLIAQQDIDLEKERYFNVYNLAPVGYCTIDENGVILEANLTASTLLGVGAGELIKQPIFSYIHNTDVDIFNHHRKELLTTGKSQMCDLRLMKKDGSEFWACLTSTNSPDERDLPLCRIVLTDITQRKMTEEALLESELNFRNLFENMQETFYEVNREGVILTVSPSVENLSKGQYKPEDLIGQPLFDLYADYSERQVFLEELQAHGIVTDYEIRLKNRDGQIVDCSISSRMQFDADGLPTKIIGSLVDITKRKQAEKALSESEARFKALHNASFGGISIHDKGVIIDCNQGLSTITGYSVTELIGMNGLLLIAEKSRSYVMDQITSGYEKPYEATGLRKSGEEFPMRLEARNVPYKGKIVRTVEFRDITEQKQIEINREKLQAELIQAQKMESVGRLAGGVAHDFNNMLGVILGYSELALESAGEDNSINFALLEIQQAAQRSADLTRQLLAFARKQTIVPTVLDLNQTLESMLNMLRRLIGEDIDLAWLPGKNLGKVKIDPSQIDQILANLTVNARDAISDTGKLTIETCAVTIDETYRSNHLEAIPGEYVMLAVSDNGSGMSQETLSHLFEPFFTTKEMGKGTGLGLATVYGIVKQNSGIINVYSEPGQGTTFKIYLPKYNAKSDQKPASDVANQATHGLETILLVEDEAMILQMSKMMAEKHGYNVLPARTPGEAIRWAKEYPGKIHLLITDVVMPEMNGRDLARTISPLLPRLKRLFMSGYTANVIAHHGVLDEGVNFIQKPFTMKDFVAKIRAVLDQALEVK